MSVRIRRIAWCLALFSLAVFAGCAASTGGGVGGGSRPGVSNDNTSNDNTSDDGALNDNAGDDVDAGDADGDGSGDVGDDDDDTDGTGDDVAVGDDDDAGGGDDGTSGGGGGAGGGGLTELTAEQVDTAFSTIWSDYDERYSHFPVKAVDWGAVRDQFAPQFTTGLSTSEFLNRIAVMLGTLNDVNVWLLDSDGELVDTTDDSPERNYADGEVDHYFLNGLDQLEDFPLFHSWMEGNIAYIGIDSFSSVLWEGLTDEQVDDVFALYADADGMVVDIRRNSGGNELFAKVFGGRLTDTAYVYGYHRTKNISSDHDDFTDFQMHRLEPWVSPPYLGPVVCLIGEENMTDAEWFVLMMVERPYETYLMGDSTRGALGSPLERSLDVGISYFIPSRLAYAADQTTTIEGVGIAPDDGLAIAPGQGTSYTDDSDLVIEEALELLAP
jgi:hypothetical protein